MILAAIHFMIKMHLDLIASLFQQAKGPWTTATAHKSSWGRFRGRSSRAFSPVNDAPLLYCA